MATTRPRVIVEQGQNYVYDVGSLSWVRMVQPVIDTDTLTVTFPTPLAVTGPLTDAQLRATSVPVSGPLTDAQLRAAPVIITGAVVVL